MVVGRDQGLGRSIADALAGSRCLTISGRDQAGWMSGGGAAGQSAASAIALSLMSRPAMAMDRLAEAAVAAMGGVDSWCSTMGPPQCTARR